MNRRMLSALAVVACLALAAPQTAPRAEAQGATQPLLQIQLYADNFLYRTLPLSAVNAEMSDPSGRRVEGIGFADDTGLAFVQLLSDVVRPADTLVVTVPGDEPLSVTVPSVGVKADLDADAVVGSAPAGGQVVVSLEEPIQLEQTVTAGPDGRFQAGFGGQADLKPGDASGRVTYLTSSGEIEVTALFAALEVDVTLGAPTISGRASPGTQVSVTRAVGGIPELVGETEVTGPGQWSVQVAPGGVPVTAGEIIVVEQSGGLENEAVTVQPVLGAMSIALNPQTDTVTGTAPPNTELMLEADAMDGTRAEAAAFSSVDGSYTHSFGSAADLGPGWRVRASYRPDPAFRVSVLGVLRKARIGIGTPVSAGRAEPGTVLTATLRTGDGTTKAMTQAQADDQGEYMLFLGGFGPNAPSVAPGDNLEIEFVGGDPLVLPVPELTARSDEPRNGVAGEAPPGARVRIDITTDPAAPRITATADPSGEYLATYTGYTLARPENGTATYVLSNGNEFFAPWAAIQINATIGNALQQNFIVGNAPGGSVVRAELRDPAGQLVGSAESVVFDGFIVIGGSFASQGPQFFMGLEDVAGTPVEMRPGDTLRITAGRELVELTIPPLDAVAFVQTNTVTGQTAPNVPVQIMVSQDGSTFGSIAREVADDSGVFGHDFTGELQLRHGDLIQLQADYAGHNLLNLVVAPGLLVDLDLSALLGSIAPNVAVDVIVTRGANTMASTRTFADGTGAFFTFLATPGGELLRVLEGDVITAIPDDPTAETLTLTVPRLEVAYDLETDRVNGSTTPGGTLTMLATEAYPRGDNLGIAQAWPAVDSPSFEATFVPAINVRPGKRLIALYRPAEGHYAYRTVTVPILNAEHSGPSTCGFDAPYNEVSVELQSAGASAARVSLPTRFDGYFADLLTEQGSDEPVSTKAGDTETMTGMETTAEIDFPALDVTVNWQQNVLQGTGPPNTMFYLAPAVPCPQQQQPALLNIQVQFGFPQMTGPDGSFQTFIPPFLSQGGGLEIAFYSPEDHRWFRHAFRVRSDIFIGSGEVRGQANPLETVQLALEDASGAAKGTAEVNSSGYGTFRGTLSNPAGQEVSALAGDVVAIQAGGQSIRLPVQPLSFDWSVAAGRVTGITVPGANVQLGLRLSSGAYLAIDRVADDQGAFGFGPSDVPPRGTWDMDDVVGVRVALPLPGGHRIIDQTASYEGPLGPGPTGSLYLPLTFKGGNPINPGPRVDSTQLLKPRGGSAGTTQLGGARLGESAQAFRLSSHLFPGLAPQALSMASSWPVRISTTRLSPSTSTTVGRHDRASSSAMSAYDMMMTRSPSWMR